MQFIENVKINVKGGGLTNNLISIIQKIITCHQRGIKICIISDFPIDYLKEETVTISSVLDFNKINDFIQPNYNVTIVDHRNIDFTCHSIKYGISFEKSFDITDKILDRISYSSSHMIIPTYLNLNGIQGDPFPMVHKNLYIEYSLSKDGIKFIDSFKEHLGLLSQNIIYDFKCINFKGFFRWINHFSLEKFDHIISNISWNQFYKNIAEDFIKKININIEQKINIIHLRCENDALNFWNKSNGVTPEQFSINLQNKYIYLINKYCKPDDITIILSYSLPDIISNFLKDKSYNYYMTDKDISKGREINALIDINISHHCTGTFIGNFDFPTLNGSTFSYYIMKVLEKTPSITKVMIDIRDIEKSELVFSG